ncbi:MAG: DUF1588 domain-containing protein [Myxococcota bacterium]|nr:DUF1588 domain-containing protein [Myxococcota bacterium]
MIFFSLLSFFACSNDTRSVNENCSDDETFYRESVAPILASKCMGCHVSDGIAGETRLQLQADDEESNFQLLWNVAQIKDEHGYLLWNKPTGQHSDGHVGGSILAQYSDEGDIVSEFIGRANGAQCGDSSYIDSEPMQCEDREPGKRLLRRLSHVEFDNSITDLFGIDSEWGQHFSPDNVSHGFNNNAGALQVTTLLSDQYMNAAEQIAQTAVQQNMNLLVSCSPKNIACGEEFLLRYGTKIFRRPLNNDEMEEYLSFFSEIYYEDGFEEALTWTIAGLLQSPHFLYRSELGVKSGSGRFELTSWEIATELSYLLWQTTPSDALLEHARNDQLRDRDQLLRIAQEMLADSRAGDTVVSMSSQWLSLNLLHTVPREEDYSVLTDELRGAMEKEINKLMQSSFSDNLTFSELLTADHSFMNAELADYYGVSLGEGDVDVDGFQRVDLSGDERYGGLLTQGALLTINASPTSSSPIHRGVMVRERLLCHELPPPPPALDTAPPAVDDSLSTRERYAAHTEDPACSSCHNLIDPIGFAFEHYDGIGRWRDRDGVHDIDVSGEVQNIDDGNIFFEGVPQLSTVLAESDQVGECYVQQWFTYGFGAGDFEDPNLACALEEAKNSYHEAGGTLQAPLLSLLQIDRFFVRSGAASEQSTLAINSDYIEQDPIDEAEAGSTESNTANLQVTIDENNWGSGYVYNVTVTNNGSESVEWEIELSVPGALTSSWNTEWEHLGDDVYRFWGVGWNSSIAPGGSESFGFQGEI